MITSEVGSASREFLLLNGLDNWDGGARGYSARVFSALLLGHGKRAAEKVAVKIARPDRLINALPVFLEEAEILTRLMQAERDELEHGKPGFPWLTPLVEFGWLTPDAGSVCLTKDAAHPDALQLHGRADRYLLTEKDAFVARLQAAHFLESQGKPAKGTPYLVLKLRPYVQHALELKAKRQQDESNHMNRPLPLDGYDVALRWLFERSYAKQRMYRCPAPMPVALEAAIQICEILETAHRCQVQYNDHKLVHYIWRPKARQVYAIDWNVAERLPLGCSEDERRARFCIDLSLFGLRVLYTLFTGRVHSWAESGQGPTSTADLNKLKELLAEGQIDMEFKSEDDQRVCTTMRELLSRLICAGYDDASKLKTDLQEHCKQAHCACFG